MRETVLEECGSLLGYLHANEQKFRRLLGHPHFIDPPEDASDPDEAYGDLLRACQSLREASCEVKAALQDWTGYVPDKQKTDGE